MSAEDDFDEYHEATLDDVVSALGDVESALSSLSNVENALSDLPDVRKALDAANKRLDAMVSTLGDVESALSSLSNLEKALDTTNEQLAEIASHLEGIASRVETIESGLGGWLGILTPAVVAIGLTASGYLVWHALR
jgi:ABC-type transporter Mla subunit MlaD